MKKIFHKLFSKAMILNKNNILNLLEKNPSTKLLDLGCDDGLWTMKVAEKIGTSQIYGIEINDEKIKLAYENNIKAIKGDLNKRFPFEDSFFDIIHSNQVIEHIAYIDNFLQEVRRVLKPGGYIVFSTENGSSWHNIFAAIMGWQIFSLTNLTNIKSGIGNPMAIHRGEGGFMSSWTHKTIFNYQGLKELFEAYDFTVIKIKGSGYHPLPANFGTIDIRHSHFLTIKAKKN